MLETLKCSTDFFFFFLVGLGVLWEFLPRKAGPKDPEGISLAWHSMILS